MSGKKEKMKALGIPEYPWSSDDDDSDVEGPLRSSLSAPPALIYRCPPPHGSSSSQGSSAINNAGAGPSSLPGPSLQRTLPSKAERDLYWSLLLTPKQTDLAMRTSSILASAREADRSALREPARRPSPLRELRGMPAFKKTERCAAQRAYANLLALRPIAASMPGRGAGPQPSTSGAAAMPPAPPPATPHAPPHATPHASLHAPPPPPAPPCDPPAVLIMDIVEIDTERSGSDARDSSLNGSGLSDLAAPVSLTEHETSLEGVTSSDGVTSPHRVPSAASLSLEEVVLEPEARAEPEPQPGPAHAQLNSSGAMDEPSPAASPSSTESRGVKRKRDDKEETDKELNQSLLRLLECPVCLEWMEPPITQCRRGHLVCAPCRARMAACPVCRTAFSSVRNRAMEGVAEMLRYPCRHGCARAVRLRRRAAHEASCPRRRYACPAPACRAAPPLPLDALIVHVQKKHPTLVKAGRRQSVQVRARGECRELWLLLALQQLFLLRVDADAAGVSLHVVYVGPKKHAKRYTYECSVVGKHDAARRVVYSRPVHTDADGAQLKHQDCFHLSPQQTLNYLRARRHCDAAAALDVTVDVRLDDARAAAADSDS